MPPEWELLGVFFRIIRNQLENNKFIWQVGKKGSKEEVFEVGIGFDKHIRKLSISRLSIAGSYFLSS